MEMINGVLQSLNIDRTIFHQFTIFLVLFFALHFVFFSRLKEVIELRKDNTTRLEENALKKFSEADRLAEEHDIRVREANQKGQELYNEYKKKVLEEHYIRIKEVEDNLSIKLEKSEKEMQKNFKAERTQLLNRTDELSGVLTDKFVG